MCPNPATLEVIFGDGRPVLMCDSCAGKFFERTDVAFRTPDHTPSYVACGAVVSLVPPPASYVPAPASYVPTSQEV